MSVEQRGDLAIFKKMAADKVGELTEFVVEAPTQKTMAAAIRNTELGSVRGEPSEDGTYVFVSYQPKLSGDTPTTPSVRACLLRNREGAPGGAHFEHMIQAVLQSRLPAVDEGCGAGIHPGDCFVIGDGGRHGNQHASQQAFVDRKRSPPRTNGNIHDRALPRAGP